MAIGLAQSLPAVVRQYDREQRVERVAAVEAAVSQWRRIGGSNISAEFLNVAPVLLAITNHAQERVAERARTYVPQVLAASGQTVRDAQFTVPTAQWVGTAGDGRATESLLYGAVTTTKMQIASGVAVSDALAVGGNWLASTLGTLLSDTARGAERAAAVSRHTTGYIRMLTPPSCGRCVILAGRWYRRNAGFERHPGCDCTSIPASEDVAGDMTTDPVAYLKSLDDAGVTKVLGSKANARAWLEFGQDSPQQTLNQLVNAYRKTGGVATAQRYGMAIKYTTEGTTVRGVAYYQMARVRELAAQGEVKTGRYRSLNAPRLMPETIFALAKDTANAERLLTKYGWLGLS